MATDSSQNPPLRLNRSLTNLGALSNANVIYTTAYVVFAVATGPKVDLISLIVSTIVRIGTRYGGAEEVNRRPELFTAIGGGDALGTPSWHS